MLDYEKLDVYRCAIEHLAFVFRSIPAIPRGYAALVDQWRRAAMSVPLNIAEAVGKTSEADRHNRYAIARGEAMECGAIIDVIRLLDAISDPDLAEAKLLFGAHRWHAEQDVPLIVDVDEHVTRDTCPPDPLTN
ncbi:MAG: four helix bundle protein [Kofleriaceae bacterium]|nr:four helix bundle protein [Kofleriaceae bacterium]